MEGRKFRHLLKKINEYTIRVIPRPIYILLYSIFGSTINYLTVRRVSKITGLNLISNLHLENLKRSDTLFILGSGSTINEITDEQWEVIGKHDSVGLNFWLLHSFTPSFYVYEEHLDQERNDIFYVNLSRKISEYKHVPIIVKDVEYKGVSLGKIPDELKKNYYLSTEIVIPDFDVQKVKKNLRFMLKIYCLINKKKIHVVPKKSGSLSYLMFMAFMMKYKKIVLCGVDLNNNKYFYDDMEVLKPLNEGHGQHPTNVGNEDNVPMELIIDMFNDFAKSYGVEIYCGNKKSALFPRYQCYFK